MGLISTLKGKYASFKKRRHEKALAKASKTISNPKATREDRAAAIEHCSELKEASEAVPILLKRFEYSLEHGINDSREKEQAMKGILTFEREALDLVREYLQTTSRIAWPIKILKQICDEAELIDAISSALNYGDIALNQSLVDKNYDLLCYLCQYSLDDETSVKLFHFLDQHDERLRFSAVETLLQQKEASIPMKLEPFLRDDSSENIRLRQAIAEAFVNNGWKLSQPEFFNAGDVIVPGINVSGKFQLKRTN